MSATVESAFTVTPRSAKAARISFSVMPGLLVASARTVSTGPASLPLYEVTSQSVRRKGLVK